MSDRATRLLDLFLEEARDALATLDLSLSSDVDAAIDVNALFRAAHTVKGGARMLGRDEIATAAESVETILQEWRESPHLARTDRRRALVALRDLRLAMFPSRDPAAEPNAGRGTGSVATVAPIRRESIRVAADRVDRVVALVGEARRANLRQAGRREIEAALSSLEESALRLRLVPLATVFDDLRRAILDAADLEGKDVTVEATGGDIELDAVVAESAFESILQVARNAVAHGVETVDERGRVGKSSRATVSIEARLDGATVAIAIADDGRGIDEADVRQRAGGRGLDAVAPILDLLCAPGFTTRDTADAMAGRGIGMDIVRDRVTRVGGAIELVTAVGRGTTFTIRLPISRAFETLIVGRINGTLVGVPRDRVLRVSASPVTDGIPVEGPVDEVHALTEPLGPLVAGNTHAQRVWIAATGEVGLVLDSPRGAASA